MADKDIIQNMISRPGQSQDDRSPPELDPHFVDIDERSAADLLAQARALAKLLRFYRDSPDFGEEDWRAFFPDGMDDAALLASIDGNIPPHLGLFAAFSLLYQHPKNAINTLTGRHLAYQFRDVLRFEAKAAHADHAHLLLELKKGTAPLCITPDMTFTAGKDDRGVELLYKPVRELIIGHGKVAALHSIYRDADNVYFAQVANSIDGKGAGLNGELDATQPEWRAFGDASLPAAPIGCAFSSPVLRMRAGNRTVLLELHLTGINSANLHTAFAAWLTGPGGWLGPFAFSGSLAGDKLTLTLIVPATEAAIVDYDTALHGHAFATQAPVLQLLLVPGAALHYSDLDVLTLNRARITVEVDALQSLTLQNDYGSLNPARAFQPFGAQPVKGSRFMIGCDEAFSKQLVKLEIRLNWQGAPASLYDWYSGYSHRSAMSNGVTAALSYQDQYGQTHSSTLDLMARNNGITVLSPVTPISHAPAGTMRARIKRPDYQHASSRPGCISLSLTDDFLHADYRRETIAHALAQNKTVLNEPYTPTVQTISLGYRAQSDIVNLNANDISNADLQFFHVGCFGQRREHAFFRAQYDKRVTLLPAYPFEGEFLIGLSGIKAGECISLLIQVSEDSADPDLPAAQLQWSVLAGNDWRRLTQQELTLDTSNMLRASGILAMTLPQQTSTEHSWMPDGLIWLRACVAKNSRAVCQLLSVSANAAEVSFSGNNPVHLSSPLAAGRITRFKTAQPSIKSVSQPYASFGGSAQESDTMLTRRAAERLRHRNRCITPWDYERMLLDAFPGVHKVKCIPHASADSWLAPGHVMLVVIADLRKQNAVDQLQPRVDIDTLVRMQEYAQQHAEKQIRIEVRNPRFQPVQLDFKVRFYPEYPYNYYRQQLQQALIAALTPWAYDKTRDIEFGGCLYRSVLLDFVEELPYVDFVTDFKMKRVSADGTPLQDVSEIRADMPDTIFVSTPGHAIVELTDI